MKIIELRAENVKRIHAVEIRPDPDGGLVVIGGRNGAGKSSVLDSIMYALGGKNAIPDVPIREGQRRAAVSVDLGELQVTRKFSQAGGSQLVVKGKDGVVLKSPQAVLDALVGRLAFDPLGFARMAPRDQLATLQAVTDVDFSELDERIREAKVRLAAVKSDRTRQETLHGVMPHHKDAPERPIDLEAVKAKLRVARAVNERAEAAAERTRTATARLKSADEVVATLEDNLSDARERVAACEATKQEAVDSAAATADRIDLSAVADELIAAQATNERVVANQLRADKAIDIGECRTLEESIQSVIQGHVDDRAAQLEAVHFPVDELGFAEDGVTLNGLPFGQAASSEQLRVSAAMGLRLNPTLRVLLIRDGSLLDEDSLLWLAGFAQEHDAQIWLERVSTGAEVSVVIEDGSVLEATG